MEGNETEEIDEDRRRERERERWVVAAYLRIYASTREKKEEEEEREERKVKVDTLVRPAFAHLCSFFTMVERLR